MANLKDMAESRATMLNFDPRIIQIKPGLNARDIDTPENREHIDGLKASIKQSGVKQSLVIFSEGDTVYVSDGHCRLTAVKELIAEGVDIKTVPCVPEQRGTNDVERVLSQNIYNSGKQLTPLEQGVNFRKAIALGGTVTQIAQLTGKSQSFIHNMINLQGAPEEVHQMVRKGEVSSSLAAEVVARRGPTGAAKVLKAAVGKARESGQTRATGRHLVAIEPRTPWQELRGFFLRNREQPVEMSDELVKKISDRLGLN